MKVGDYVRTEKGKIDKYSPIWVEYNKFEDSYYYVYPDEEDYYDHRELIIKSSPNIIDLIEVGDYVNGLPVERIGRTLDDENDIRVWFGVATYGRTILNQINHRYTVKDEFEDDYSLRFRCIKPEDIKSIVTKEQFTSMEYKL